MRRQWLLFGSGWLVAGCTTGAQPLDDTPHTSAARAEAPTTTPAAVSASPPVATAPSATPTTKPALPCEPSVPLPADTKSPWKALVMPGRCWVLENVSDAFVVGETSEVRPIGNDPDAFVVGQTSEVRTVGNAEVASNRWRWFANSKEEEYPGDRRYLPEHIAL